MKLVVVNFLEIVSKNKDYSYEKYKNKSCKKYKYKNDENYYHVRDENSPSKFFFGNCVYKCDVGASTQYPPS